MNSLVPWIAALTAFFALSTPAIAADDSSGASSPARRSAGGAEATARVTIRIIAQSARIGLDYPAPQVGMVARSTTISAADGSAVPALMYDFE